MSPGASIDYIQGVYERGQNLLLALIECVEANALELGFLVNASKLSCGISICKIVSIDIIIITL